MLYFFKKSGFCIENEDKGAALKSEISYEFLETNGNLKIKFVNLY